MTRRSFSAILLAACLAESGHAADAPSPFAKSYLSAEVVRNVPLSFSQNRFEAGPPHPLLGYRHNLSADWMMGLGAQFKMLRRNASAEERPGGELAIWTLSHEALYSVRLQHPTYLLVGPKIHYLLPTNAGKLPLQRASEHQTEIGFAVSAAIVRVIDARGLVSVRVDRWRGTRTMRFHGLEVALGYSWALSGP